MHDMPPPDFDGISLSLRTVPAGSRFGRIYLKRYPAPLGIGKTKSRFSDPRDLPEKDRYGVLYLGSTFRVCFLETYVRDKNVGLTSSPVIYEDEIDALTYAQISVAADLSLVDLTGGRQIRMGVPTDVAHASAQELARQWALAFFLHRQAPDGIYYQSRLNGEFNLAIFDRAIGKLSVDGAMSVMASSEYFDLIESLNAIVYERTSKVD